MIVCDSLKAIEDLVGHPAQCSTYRTVSQERINAYADLSGDHQWIHVDPERSARESPYGTTIAHGLLTLSMLGEHLNQCYAFPNRISAVFYGFDKLRFVRGVPSGARVRGRFALETAQRVSPNTIHCTWNTLIEIEGHDKPAIAATMLNRSTY